MHRHLISILLLCIGLTAVAEQQKTFGEYEVHYSVLNTTFIEPATASAYGITRGRDKALINIAIRKQLTNGQTRAQRAVVTGCSSDLMRSTPLTFKEVDENEAIYYIAELKFFHKEMRTFTIKVQPDPNMAAYTLKFSKTMYRDE